MTKQNLEARLKKEGWVKFMAVLKPDYLAISNDPHIKLAMAGIKHRTEVDTISPQWYHQIYILKKDEGKAAHIRAEILQKDLPMLRPGYFP
jgi:hypothetical protein